MFFEVLIHNQWLWFHIIAGGIVAGFIYWIAKNMQPEARQKTAVFGTIGLAIVYEVIERFTNIDAYPSVKYFMADATWDIIGAGLMAIILVYFLAKIND